MQAAIRCNTLAFSPPPSSSHALHPKSLTSPSPQAPPYIPLHYHDRQAISDAITVHISPISPLYLPISRPYLQAIFDAILVHIVNLVSPSGKWQQLQQQMCACANLLCISPISSPMSRGGLGHMRLQPRSHTVAARIACGCRYIYIRLQVRLAQPEEGREHAADPRAIL